MILMLRGLVVLATLFAAIPLLAGQALSVLHIKVVLVDADRKATPVPRHALLISDNPSSAPPRRIVTSLDGTADVRLRPGNYTVESDVPVAFDGKRYEWTKTLDILAGRDATLELTADNAEVEAVGAATISAAPFEADPWVLLSQWHNSVVTLWTPTTHASGFVIDANGLIATNQRVLGTATAVDVQLTPAVKVAARILVADPVRDVAVLWIDPTAVRSVRPVPLGCALQAQPVVVNGQKVFAIEAPLLQQKGTTSGTVSGLETHTFVSDLGISSDGGPVFTGDGSVVGISSVVDERLAQGRGNSRVVRIGDVCNVVASAEQKMKDATPPDGTRLPVDPVRAFPVAALEVAPEVRAGSLSPYQMSSSDFDIAFITPVLTYGAQRRSEQISRRDRSSDGRPTDAEQAVIRTLTDFSNWSKYVAAFPPVLLVRTTPKLVEGFWTKVARGAAQTQGVAHPPMKHVKSGFSRMRAFCGDAEVTPIHPFKLEQRVSERDAIYEGLYVFDSGALGPPCGTVKLVLYSEKETVKGDTVVVEAKVVQQIWQDFAPYRALK
jgi:S1-C subfamily serine protease